MGANKRHRQISVRGGGIRTKLPKTSCAFLLYHEGGRLLSSVPIGAHLTHHCTRQLLRFFCTKLPLRYYPGEFLKLLTEPKALIEGTSRAAITKEVRVRVRQRPSSRPLREDSLLQMGDSLLRSKLSGEDTLLRSKLSGGHSAT